ncbi:MAG: multidrug ABC transporter ATP-binding protein [Nitrosomonadales bacterium SCN 54-20]|nr:MAG: multidrug ABC transporter ATP-binding protein [Nitrosomonadales bacterium SCN 54-20]
MSAKTEQKTVSARDLIRYFGARIAVDQVSLELGQGEVLGLLGPNGAGKTTIMRLLTGNLAPNNGKIEICGMDLQKQTLKAKACIGYLPEIPPLYRELTIDEYLRLAVKLRRLARSKTDDAIRKAVEHCGLDNVRRRLIGSLSKGYQQRAGIAQAIIHDPAVIILDEPTSGLDPNQMRDVRSLIRELGAMRSVIFSTHALSEVESVCDRVQIINHGRQVFEGPVDRMKLEGTRLEEIFTQSTMEKIET